MVSIDTLVLGHPDHDGPRKRQATLVCRSWLIHERRECGHCMAHSGPGYLPMDLGRMEHPAHSLRCSRFSGPTVTSA